MTNWTLEFCKTPCGHFWAHIFWLPPYYTPRAIQKSWNFHHRFFLKDFWSLEFLEAFRNIIKPSWLYINLPDASKFLSFAASCSKLQNDVYCYKSFFFVVCITASCFATVIVRRCEKKSTIGFMMRTGPNSVDMLSWPKKECKPHINLDKL